MRTIAVIVPVLFFAACGKDLSLKRKGDLPAVSLDAELDEILQEFKSTATANGSSAGPTDDLRILKFVPDAETLGEESHLAVCDKKVTKGNAYYETATWKEVRVAEVVKQHPDALKWIVFHELGHCLLGKKHDDSKFSIMNEFVSLETIRYTEDEWQDLTADLFRR